MSVPVVRMAGMGSGELVRWFVVGCRVPGGVDRVCGVYGDRDDAVAAAPAGAWIDVVDAGTVELARRRALLVRWHLDDS